MKTTLLLFPSRWATGLILLMSLPAAFFVWHSDNGTKTRAADDSSSGTGRPRHFTIKGRVLDVTKDGDLKYNAFTPFFPSLLTCRKNTALVTDRNAGMVKGKPFFALVLTNRDRETTSQAVVTLATLQPLPAAWQEHLLATQFSVNFISRNGSTRQGNPIRKGDLAEFSISLKPDGVHTILSLGLRITRNNERLCSFFLEKRAPTPEQIVTSPSPMEEVAIKKRDVEYKTRRPIPYRPLEPIDPKTGKKLPGNTIVTTPNGVRATVDEVYREANRMEREFNKHGYSLRTDSVDELGRNRVNQADNKRQEQAFAGLHQHLDPSIGKFPSYDKLKEQNEKPSKAEILRTRRVNQVLKIRASRKASLVRMSQRSEDIEKEGDENEDQAEGIEEVYFKFVPFFQKRKWRDTQKIKLRGTIRLALPAELQNGVRYVFEPDMDFRRNSGLSKYFRGGTARNFNKLTNSFPIHDAGRPDAFWHLVNKSVTIDGTIGRFPLTVETNKTRLRKAEGELPYLRRGQAWIGKDSKKEVVSTFFFRDSGFDHFPCAHVIVPGTIVRHKDTKGKPQTITRPSFTKRPGGKKRPDFGKEGGYTKSWDVSQGNKGVMAVGLTARIHTSLEARGMKLEADAAVNGYMMGKQASLLKAEAHATSPIDGDASARLTLSILNKKVKEMTLPSKRKKKNRRDEWKHTFKHEVSFRIPLGPIPVRGTVGVEGTVGVSYFIGLRGLGIDGHITPFGECKAYARIGIDLLIVKFGVGGELTLIDVKLKIGARVELDVHRIYGLFLGTQITVEDEITMLSGRLYIWAKVWLIFKTKEFRHNFCTWPGIKRKGCLVQTPENRHFMQDKPPLAFSRTPPTLFGD